MLCAHGWAGQTQLHFWWRILQSKIRNSAAAESEGGQKFLPPSTPFLFARPSVSVLRAKLAVSSVQKRFGFRHIIAQKIDAPRRMAGRTGTGL